MYLFVEMGTKGTRNDSHNDGTRRDVLAAADRLDFRQGHAVRKGHLLAQDVVLVVANGRKERVLEAREIAARAVVERQLGLFYDAEPFPKDKQDIEHPHHKQVGKVEHCSEPVLITLINNITTKRNSTDVTSCDCGCCCGCGCCCSTAVPLDDILRCFDADVSFSSARLNSDRNVDEPSP